jgi:hypothetical protein
MSVCANLMLLYLHFFCIPLLLCITGCGAQWHSRTVGVKLLEMLCNFVTQTDNFKQIIDVYQEAEFPFAKFILAITWHLIIKEAGWEIKIICMFEILIST